MVDYGDSVEDDPMVDYGDDIEDDPVIDYGDDHEDDPVIDYGDDAEHENEDEECAWQDFGDHAEAVSIASYGDPAGRMPVGVPDSERDLYARTLREWYLTSLYRIEAASSRTPHEPTPHEAAFHSVECRIGGLYFDMEDGIDGRGIYDPARWTSMLDTLVCLRTELLTGLPVPQTPRRSSWERLQ